jgi:hypothetical protein
LLDRLARGILERVTDESGFVAEVLRLHQRYTVEVVEKFDICPWARHARESGAWVREVLLQRDEALAPTLAAIDRLESDPKKPDVAILIFPRLGLPPRRFDEMAGRLRQADQDRHQGKPIFVSATFHPDYPISHASPAALVPFFRRSPDPSLQLIRLSVLEEARGPAHGKFLFDFSTEKWAELMKRQQQPSVTDRITRDNHAMLAREGVARLEAIYAELAEDRARSYARFVAP